jgi:uncharacterized protein YceH (UPF0502 family)
MDEPLASGSVSAPPSVTAQPRWQPLAAIERRVAGVLVEKAKTTPDVYPMTINALVAGCNQKSNRHPVMQVEAEDVEAALDRLRALGAVGIVQGSGRVDKYRHYLYEWLGVEKVEMAVMVELLLRGAQTEGELRGRAARMEPIADVAALRPVLDSLKAKCLLIPLTPEGRGHVLTHALYEPRELEKLRAQAAGGAYTPPGEATRNVSSSVSAAQPAPGPEAEGLAGQLEDLRQQVRQLRSDLDEVMAELGRRRDA